MWTKQGISEKEESDALNFLLCLRVENINSQPSASFLLLYQLT